MKATVYKIYSSGELVFSTASKRDANKFFIDAFLRGESVDIIEVPARVFFEVVQIKPNGNYITISTFNNKKEAINLVHFITEGYNMKNSRFEIWRKIK